MISEEISISILTPPTTQTPFGIRLSVANRDNIEHLLLFDEHHRSTQNILEMRINIIRHKKASPQAGFTIANECLVLFTSAQEENAQRDSKQNGEDKAVNEDHR